jgi:hypothetical protein
MARHQMQTPRHHDLQDIDPLARIRRFRSSRLMTAGDRMRVASMPMPFRL